MSGDTIRSVGVIGLGNMGGGMAASLARAGFAVTGHDVSAAAMERAQANGVAPATGVAAAVENADAILTMLPDSPDVERCLLGDGGVREHARRGALVVDSSTIAPAVTDRAAQALGEAGIAFVDAPVGRSPAQAATGTLLFMVGAANADLERARPLLDAMGDTVFHCGGVGTGIRTKLVLNLLGQVTNQLSAETVALGLKLGLDRDALLGVLCGGLGANGFIRDYWPTKVLAGDTAPGFAIGLSAKDMRLAAAMAEAAGVAIPTGAAGAAAINRAAERHGDLDVSGLLAVACEAAGVDLNGDPR